MFPTTTMHLTHKYWHSTLLHQQDTYKLFFITVTYYYKFKSDPQILNMLCFMFMHTFQVASVAMHSLWEVCHSNITAYTTIYSQIQGASSSFS